MDLFFLILDSIIRGAFFIFICYVIIAGSILTKEYWDASRGKIIYEAKCEECDEVFCPPNRFNLIHEYTEDGFPCGGFGNIFARYTV